MSLLQVVFITTLCIGCGLSGANDRCKIFKQGTKIQWPYTDMMKYMSQGDVFNATCRCIGHQSASIWRVFDKDGSQINVSPDASTLCNIGTESCTDIYLTITEPLIVLCFTILNNIFQYSRPVVINIKEAENNCTLSSTSPSPSQSSTYHSYSTTSPSMSLITSKSPFPSMSSLLPSSLFLSPSSSLMTSNVIISSPVPSSLAEHSSCSNLTITVTTTFSTVIVTIAPTTSIHTEPTTSSTATTSSTSYSVDFITTISTSVDTKAQVDDKCTPTLLAVVVPIGCTVIVLVLLVIAMLCIVVAVKKCSDRRPKYTDEIVAIEGSS